MKLTIIIPVYNEKDTVIQVIERILKSCCHQKEILVVDDFSTDGTRDILTKFSANKKDILLICHEKNFGKGRSIRTGLKHATGDIVVIQDADLELDPAEIDNMFAIMENNNKIKAVFGSRFKDNRIKFFRNNTATFIANMILTGTINILYKTRLTDIMTCYKMIRREVFVSLNLTSDRFDIESEITCKLIAMHIGIYEIPIKYKPRGWEEGKKIRFNDFFKVIKSILKNKLG